MTHAGVLEERCNEIIAEVSLAAEEAGICNPPEVKLAEGRVVWKSRASAGELGDEE